MMTGPEHYAEAEAQLIEASGASTAKAETYYLGRAQVHATLALAAATAATTLAPEYGPVYGYGQMPPEPAF